MEGLKQRAEIKALEAQKQKLLHPITMRSVMSKLKEQGITPEEVAKRMGIEI